jgi:hypothetical protein
MPVDESKEKVVFDIEKAREKQKLDSQIKQERIAKIISNYTDADKETLPLDLNAILDKIKPIEKIVKINGVLHANFNDKLHVLKNDTDLFSQLQQLGYYTVFKSFPGAASKKDIYSAMTRLSDDFTSISVTPTWPIEDKVYYTCPPIVPAPTGALDELLSHFKPLDEYSAALLKALFISPAWGNGDGKRPIFVIQSDPNWIGRKMAFGKSTIPKLLSYLYSCTPISLSARMDEFQAQKRIAIHRNSRIILFDNVKQQNWSSEFVESLVTAQTINGHLMYVGDITIRNHFTIVVTVNDPSVSADMATRSVPIYLANPGDKHCTWQSGVEAFIKEHREAIMADILHILSQPNVDEKASIRFPEWEASILSKLCSDKKMGNYIEEGQTLIDSDRNNWWEDIFILALSKYTSHGEYNYFEKKQDVTKVSWWISNEVLQDLYQKHCNLKNASPVSLGKKIKSELAKFVSWDVYEFRHSFGRGTVIRGYNFEPKGATTASRYIVKQLSEKERFVECIDK